MRTLLPRQTRHAKPGNFVTSHERQRWLEWAVQGKTDVMVKVKDILELDLPWYDRPARSASEALIRKDLIAIGRYSQGREYKSP